MASDFWTSTHCNTWLIPLPTLDHLLLTLPDHALYSLPIPSILTLHIHFSSLIHKLSRKISLRQSAIATACVYFKRFYTKNAFAETDPFLVLIACVYVAAKVEECPVHVKSVLSEARACLSEHSPRPLPTDYTKLAEMEFYLLEELEFDLVVYHPYSTLMSVCGREVLDDGYWSDDDYDPDDQDGDVNMEPSNENEGDDDDDRGAKSILKQMKRREKKRGKRRPGETEQEWINRVWGRGSGRGSWQVDDGVFQMAWFIINDSYKTHLSLLYPPYMIALAALYLAFSLEDKSSTDSHRLRGKVLMPYKLGDEAEHGHPDDVPVYYVQKPTTQPGADGSHHNNTNNHNNMTPGIGVYGGNGDGNDPTGDFEPIKLLTRTNAPRLFASLDVSLPMLLSIVQHLVSLYPLWDSFAPRRNPGQGSAPGAGGVGSGSGSDPKAHLMAYRAAQALRRAQAVDKEREGREMVLNARESTKAHLQAGTNAGAISSEGRPDRQNGAIPDKDPLSHTTSTTISEERPKRYPEHPLRYPPGPHLTEEGVPALLTTLWREVASRQERAGREGRRAG